MALPASTPRTHDAENHDAIRFTAVLDDVVFEVIYANVRLLARSWMANIRKGPNEFKCIFKNLVIVVPLIGSSGCFRVLKDVLDVQSCPGRNGQPNT